MSWDDVKNTLGSMFPFLGIGANAQQQPQGGTLPPPQGTLPPPQGGAAPPQAGAPVPAAGAPTSPGASATPSFTGMDMGPFGQLTPPTTSFLDDPRVAAAISAYVNFAGSPRYEGWGGAIRRAGTGALSAYEEARKQQYQPYLMAAQLGKDVAETGKSKAEAALAGARAEEIKGVKAQNVDMGNYLETLAKTEPDPMRAANLIKEAGLVKRMTTTGFKVSDAFADVDKMTAADKNAAQAKLDYARQGLVQEETKTEPYKRYELGARAGEETATGVLRGQEALTQPDVRAELQARADRERLEGATEKKRPALLDAQIKETYARADLTGEQKETEASRRVLNYANADLASGRLSALSQQVANQTAEAAARIQKETDPATQAALIAKARDDNGKLFDQSLGPVRSHFPWLSQTTYLQRKEDFINARLAQSGLIYVPDPSGRPGAGRYRTGAMPTIPPMNLGGGAARGTPGGGGAGAITPAAPLPDGWRLDPRDPSGKSAFDAAGNPHHIP